MKKLFTFIVMALMAVGANAQTKTTIWEGSVTFDESWSGNFMVGKEQFAGIKAGDQLILTAKPEAAVSWQWGAQVFMKTQRAGWSAIAPTVSVTAEGTFTVNITDENQEISYDEYDENGNKTASGKKMNTTMVAELTEQGLVVQGIDATVTKLELVSNEAVEYQETGTNIEFDEYGNITSDKFASFSDKAKVVFTVQATGEATNADGSIIGWGIGVIKSLDSSVTVGELALKKIGDNEYTFTIADLKAALEAPKNQYDMQGINWNVWNQGNATCSRKSVVVYEVKSSSVSAIKTAQQSGVRYNLAGQKVDASYKGVVIENGRKLIQK